jgi:isopentenyldiphosphate isomerase
MSDKVQELLEVYTEDGKPTNIGKPRGEIHKKGLYHKAVKIWNVNSFEKINLKKRKGEILIQQRVFTKESYPGMWDATAAGHVVFGETSEETASIEFEEELGIKIPKEKFQFLFTTLIESVLNDGLKFNN